MNECINCKWYETPYGCPEVRIDDKCIMCTPYTEAEKAWHKEEEE